LKKVLDPRLNLRNDDYEAGSGKLEGISRELVAGSWE
jgi:hypothetical protein